MVSFANTLNAGTARGAAYGLKLSSFSALFDTKDAENRPAMLSLFKVMDEQPDDVLKKYLLDLKIDALE